MFGSEVSDAIIEQGAALLRAGRLVAFPTETVYGLGGDATNDRAVAAIFDAKGRPRFNPLIAHVPDIDAASRLAVLDDRAARLARAFWPGPLTLVLPRRGDSPVSLLASAGLDTIAVRVPAHPIAQRLLRAAGRPIAAPSANRSGRVSPTTADHVRAELGDRVALVVDGGPCRVGLESTVLDLGGGDAHPALLRPGAVTREALEPLVGPLADAPAAALSDEDAAPRAPGMLASHYAPSLPVRLDATDARPGEAYLGFGPAGAAEVLSLSRGGDLVEAAANLFAMLRMLDRPEAFTGIAVAPVPETGLGAAINDRLRRAAAPRPA
ncbi:MAG TPA: L-threonylcarbamoyladenylate synthase [Stellaceae bacterium]|jgi:L-threonylcarbamoyladenylate synthase